MAEDHTADRLTDAGESRAGETPTRVDKATVKEALSDLLGEIPAFRELMSLPGPSTEAGAHGRRDAEGSTAVSPSPGPGELIK